MIPINELKLKDPNNLSFNDRNRLYQSVRETLRTDSNKRLQELAQSLTLIKNPAILKKSGHWLWYRYRVSREFQQILEYKILERELIQKGKFFKGILRKLKNGKNITIVEKRILFDLFWNIIQ